MCDRYFSRSAKWLFKPDDNMLLAEFESEYGPLHKLTEDERRRLSALDALDTDQSTKGPVHGEAQVSA